MKNRKRFEARIVTANPHRAGQLVAQVGHILARVFSEAKRSLRISVVSFVICPDCEQKRKSS